ncbi:hypothetical protein SAMN02745118_01815 [Selenihalanaerobacter shriftii]|uniref:Uncharacterized protein n=1 Tax=Selenihalanaerobacter shriftii TaxID=142842 RepID=A0A1T4NI84_9FIRM|nr:hypothetical protein SAMN02745118_01815 [Selenihalanaerobacter shriftii]
MSKLIFKIGNFSIHFIDESKINSRNKLIGNVAALVLIILSLIIYYKIY